MVATPTPSGPAGFVLAAWLAEQRDEVMRADAALHAGESHALHDLRVAMRRVRTALATFRPLVDRTVTDPLRDELRWASGELGRARDREVVARRISRLLADEPPELVLGPVAARVKHFAFTKHLEGADQVHETIESDRYAAMLGLLDELAEAPPFRPLAVSKKARKFVRKRVHADLTRVLKRAEAAYPIADGARRGLALHEVRKAAKRLRYAAEAGRPVTGRGVRHIRTRAKRLQRLLGDHHDAMETRTALRLLAVQANSAAESSFTYGRLHGMEQARAERLEATARDVVRRLDASETRKGPP